MKAKWLLAIALVTTGAPEAQAGPLVVPPGHWQEGMAVGVAEFNGTLHIRGPLWQWQPQSLPVNSKARGLVGQSGEVSASRSGQWLYILGGHTTALLAARPGIQPEVSLLDTDPAAPRLAVRGELSRGQIRYGEVSFRVSHILAYQDRAMAETGWGRVSGDAAQSGVQGQVKRLLWQVPGYAYRDAPSGIALPASIFTSAPEPEAAAAGHGVAIAGAWVTMLQDLRVRFPGAEEAVTRWQGNLTPVVAYF